MTINRLNKTARSLLVAAALTCASTLAGKAQEMSVATPASDTSVLAVLQTILSNPTDLAFVEQYTTDDFTYASLNFGNPEVKRVLPWAGTTEGAAGLVQAFVDVGRYWTVDDFTIQDSFENEDGAAMFGTFTYTSNTLGKTVTSPFAVLARGENGKLSYVQFMEDTYATVRSFRNSGTYRIKADPEGGEEDI
ncbi:nuclear transport factor 2 family protein [Paracoccus nototheniae]|uniref:Nuclear transport factor 2 family protein n=1 Tax=Paracoccus nototheniae TaxID=2489002 RepID=A0ABW4DXT3_9RHOB|nr:nuclear transport factor 2 family protein [Paracoccus nototheniae]